MLIRQALVGVEPTINLVRFSKFSTTEFFLSPIHSCNKFVVTRLTFIIILLYAAKVILTNYIDSNEYI